MKKRIIILAILLTLCITVTANGEAVYRQLDAAFTGIKVLVNGKAIEAKDGSGNAVEPFIVDGVTYLPVRAIAEALDKDVSYNADTRTVSITDKVRSAEGVHPTDILSTTPPAATPNGQVVDLTKENTSSIARLTDKDPVAMMIVYNGSKRSLTNNEVKKISGTVADNYGNKYTEGYTYFLGQYGGYNSAYSQHNVEGYTTLSGTFALANSYKDSPERVILRVFGVTDKNDAGLDILYKSPVTSAGSRPININVDFSGYKDITLSVSACDKDGNILSGNDRIRAYNDIGLIFGNTELK